MTPTYTIFTGGPIITRQGTLPAVKAYVEQHAPMRRGWTSRWEKRQGAHVYVRTNSRGRDQTHLTITVRLGVW